MNVSEIIGFCFARLIPRILPLFLTERMASLGSQNARLSGKLIGRKWEVNYACDKEETIMHIKLGPLEFEGDDGLIAVLGFWGILFLSITLMYIFGGVK